MFKLWTALLASMLMILGAAASLAQIDVELAFDPEVVYPGDTVTMFAGIANLGDTDVVADIELTLTLNDMDFGPFAGQLSLAAGEELSREFSFYIPPVPMDVTLVITVTATAGDYSDTATANLTIMGQDGDDGSETFNDIGQDMVDALTGAAAPSNAKSMGQFKNQYR